MAAGVALAGLGASLAFLPLLLLLLVRPIGPFHRPGFGARAQPSLLIGGVIAGWLYGAGVLPAESAAPPTGRAQLSGWYESAGTRTAILHGVRGVPDGAADRAGPNSVRLTLRTPGARPDDPGAGAFRSRPSAAPLDGRRVEVYGSWMPPWRTGLAPTLSVDSAVVVRGGVSPLSIRLRLRAALRQRIEEVFPTQGGLVAALIIADRSGLDPAIRDDFTRTGTAHLLAISGFHVGVLAGWIILLLGAVGLDRRRRILVAAGCVWVYVALIGFPTSAVRAALLISALAAGRARGRPVHLLGAWGVALLTVAVVSPQQILSPGTQLSFAGSLGLLVWARPWGQVLGGDRPARGAPKGVRVRYVVGTAVGASAAAQLMTLPFVVIHFQRVALLGLPASLIATPPVAFALPGTLLALVVDLVPGPVGTVLAAGVEGLLGATIRIVGALARLDGGVWLGPAQLAGAGFGLLVAAGARWRGRARVAAAISGLMLAPVALGVFGRQQVEIHLFDVGQGDAIGIRTPRGAWMLVDAGPGPGEEVVRALVGRGATRLEAMVLTHPDMDHIGGAAEIVRQIPVDRMLGSGLLRGTEAVADLARAVEASRTRWAVLRTGDSWQMDGVELTVLHSGGTPEMPPNDHSVVLHLRYGDFDMLLTGDVGSAVEDSLPARLPAGTSVEVLKVAHHGSRTSTSEPFLGALSPSAAVVSLARDNRFGHPAPEVVRLLQERGIPLSRTDVLGALHLTARRNGSWSIRSERGIGN